MHRLTPLLSLVLLAAACTNDAGASTDSVESDTSLPPGTIPPTTAAPTTAAPEQVPGAELVGRWAHYDVVAYEDDVLKTLIIS